MLSRKAPSFRDVLSCSPHYKATRHPILLCVPRLRCSVQTLAAPSDPPSTERAQRPTQERFNEGFASVRRLIDRDKKEFINPAGTSSGDILDKFVTEFGEGTRDGGDGSRRPATQPMPGAANPFDSNSTSTGSQPDKSTSTASTTSSSEVGPPSINGARPGAPGAAPVAREISPGTPNPFKAPGASPFAASAAPKPFRSAIEPAGLSPDMGPDVMEKDKPFDLFASIGLTQIVLFLSFSTIIGLMLTTFWVVWNSGAISIAGVD